MVKQRAYTSYHRCEGVIGEDLDLRELQQSGRIGRIKVELNSEGGKSQGTITIPCSLDRTETAVLAAAMETVDRVGPCAAKITLEKLEDVREAKRKRIIERAVDLLRDWEGEVSPDSQEMTDTVMRETRTAGIVKLGKEKLPAGPDAETSNTIIVDVKIFPISYDFIMETTLNLPNDLAGFRIELENFNETILAPGYDIQVNLSLYREGGGNFPILVPPSHYPIENSTFTQGIFIGINYTLVDTILFSGEGLILSGFVNTTTPDILIRFKWTLIVDDIVIYRSEESYITVT